MQINTAVHGERAYELGIDLDSLKGNVDYAEILYKEQGLKPWSPSKKCWQ
jgi:hypothetical protein